jgi:hypothetical protein
MSKPAANSEPLPDDPQVLKAWQKERPELFHKAVYDLPGLDSPVAPVDRG